MPSVQEWIDCDGLPAAKCNAYRRRRGLPPIPNARLPQLDHTVTTESGQQGFRGLGDLVHAAAVVTGAAAVVGAVSKATGRPCGCEKRREWLNQAFPMGK